MKGVLWSNGSYSWLRKFIVALMLLQMSLSGTVSAEYIKPMDISHAEQEFLANNSQIVRFDVDEDLYLLEPYVDDTVVFLSGEWHFTRASNEWELLLLKYLHREAGVRVLLIEHPYSIGYLLNHYVNGGELRVHLEHPVLREFFSDLRAFNLDLPADQRIRVVGIEAEFDYELSVSLLEELLQENKMNDFWRVIRGLEQGKHLRSIRERDGVHASLTTRDRYSYLNFVDLYAEMDDARFFGQWGAVHAYRRKYNEIVPLPANLDSPESPVTGRVVTIQAAYSGTFTAQGPYPILEGDPTVLQQLAGGDVTLFRLAAPQSPFDENLYLIPRNTGGVTTDYMQFLAYFGRFTPAWNQ